MIDIWEFTIGEEVVDSEDEFVWGLAEAVVSERVLVVVETFVEAFPHTSESWNCPFYFFFVSFSDVSPISAVYKGESEQ